MQKTTIQTHRTTHYSYLVWENFHNCLLRLSISKLQRYTISIGIIRVVLDSFTGPGPKASWDEAEGGGGYNAGDLSSEAKEYEEVIKGWF